MSDSDCIAKIEDAQPVSAKGPEVPRESGSIGKSVFHLALGRGAAIGVGLLSAPILSRLYDPEDFGVFGLVLAISAVVGAFSSLSYQQAIPLAKSFSELRDLVVLSFLINTALTCVLILAAVFGGRFLALLFDEPLLSRYTVFVAVLFLLNGISALVAGSLNYARRFGVNALQGTTARIAASAGSISAAFLGLGKSPLGLLAGSLVGVLAGVVFFCRLALEPVFAEKETSWSLAGLRAVAREYRNFPCFQIWSGLLNSLTVNLPVFIIGSFFPVEVVGFYAVANRLLMLPVQLFSSSGAQVFYVESARSVRSGVSVASGATELLRLLVVITSFPFLLLVLLGPLLAEVVLGPAWRETGVFAQILAPWIMITAVASPLSSILLVKNRLAENLVYNIVLLVGRAASLGFGAWCFGPRVALALFVAVSSAVWLQLFARVLALASVSRWWVLVLFLRTYGEVFLLLAPVALLYWIGNMKYITLGGVTVVGCVQLGIICHRYPRVRAMVLGPIDRLFGRGGRRDARG